MVPEVYEAWHAGKSNWKSDKSLNKKSIGIEIANKGHQFGYQNYSKKQIKSLIKLSKYLKAYSERGSAYIRTIQKIIRTNRLGQLDNARLRYKKLGEILPWFTIETQEF